MFGLCNLNISYLHTKQISTHLNVINEPTYQVGAYQQNLNQIRVNVIIECNSYIRKRFYNRSSNA